jgi:hypothetical protein
MESEKKDNKTTTLFGIVINRKELVINGLVFLLINAGYSIFTFLSQLPEGFRENIEVLNEFEFQQPSMIVTLFLTLFGYILIDRGIFGSDVNSLIEKHGVSGYFLRKIFLMLSIIFVTLALQVIILLFIL